jgi:hypothetical protein
VALYKIGITAFVVLAACGGGRSGGDGRTFAEVFRDFIFLGSFPEVRGRGIPVHGYDPVSLPPLLVPGHLYVFQHVGPLDIDEFGVSELPRRMKAAGLRILHAPKSKDDMAVGEPTGSVWWIDFQMRAHKGRIYPWLDPVLYQRGGLAPNGCPQALVVTIEE